MHPNQTPVRYVVNVKGLPRFPSWASTMPEMQTDWWSARIGKRLDTGDARACKKCAERSRGCAPHRARLSGTDRENAMV